MNNLLSTYRIYFLLFTLTSAFNVLQAQVPVHQEPRHKPVFQTADVRVLNVLLPPGDTSLYHIHSTPSLFIFFTSTNTGSQLQGKSALPGKSVAGRMLFENLGAPNIRIHRVWNTDSDDFHVMDIELLYKDSAFTQPTLSSPELQLEIDTTFIRAYRLSLPKGKEFILENKAPSFILVSLHNANLQTSQSGKSKKQTVKPGSYFDIKRRESFSIRNISNDTVEFCLLELPR